MRKNETSNGKKGGLLKGKPHYDKNGKPLGGIKAIVTDTNTPVELEGGEVIINKHASKKYWRELSKINQSAGNGVPIHNPNGNEDEDPEEYRDGGRIIDFNPNHLPNKRILTYAKKIKSEYPKVWDIGGNIFGNEAFKNLQRVSERGYWLESEKWMYIKWRSFVARHTHDFRIKGVIAMLKWVDKVEKGWQYMKDLIEAEIDKKYPSKMANGGRVTTYKNKFNQKYGFKSNESHSLEEIAKLTKIKLSALQDIYDKGIGAYKTNPESVRPNVKSKEQWAMARVYSAVMGGKASRIDKNELMRGKMANGGIISWEDFRKSQFNEEEDRYLPSGFLQEYKIEKNIKEKYPILIEKINGLEYRKTSNDSSEIAVFYKNDKVGYADNKAIQIANEYQKKGIGVELIHLIKEQNPSHRFGSMTPEGFNLMGSYYDKKIANKKEKGGLIAPNGKPSNLNAEQYKLVRTKAFKDWFGDWENDPENASKVVDENGEPLVVYHGSRQVNEKTKFNIFNFGNGAYGEGIYFTSNFKEANGWALGNFVYKTFLNVKNPFVEKWYNKWMPHKTIENDFDGIIVKDIDDITMVVAFKPEQIKLADGSNTIFDGGNPDIRYADGGLIAPNGKPSNLNAEQYKLVRTKAFKDWFGDWENDPENASKIVDENGEPLMCFHGSPNKFNEFDYEYIGTSNDNGFYGKGFYFTFQKEFKDIKWAIGEASYYGKNVNSYYIKSVKPFDFQSLEVYKGKRINFIGANSLVFLYNIAKLFPNLAKEITIDKYTYNPSTDENDITYVPISILINLVDKYSRELKIGTTKNEYDENVSFGYVKSEIVKYDYTETGGTKGEYNSIDDLGQVDSRLSEEEKEIFFINLAIKKYDRLSMDYNPEGYMTRYPKISEAIKENYDSILQSQYGDELVVFEPTQIKLADGSNTTFDGKNPDIRYDKGGELAKGIKAEKEHIDTAKKLYNQEITPEESAKEIALDHLKENSKYYTELAKLEKKFEKGGSLENSNKPYVYPSASKPIFWQMTMKQFCDYAKANNMDTRLEGTNAKLQCEDFYKYTIVQPLLSDKAERNVYLLAIQSNRMPYELVEEIIRSVGMWGFNKKVVEITKYNNQHKSNAEIWQMPKDLYLQKEVFSKNYSKEDADKWYKEQIYNNVYVVDVILKDLIIRGLVKYSDVINRIRESIGIENLTKEQVKELDSFHELENKTKTINKLNYLIDLIESEKVYTSKVKTEISTIQDSKFLSANKIDFIETLISDIKNDSVKHNKITVEKLGQKFGIEEQNTIKELAELSISIIARELAHTNGLTDEEKYYKIVDLYKIQPNLSHRTSQSMMMQQYSTPAPIGYLMGLYCGINKNGVKYFEPSAGNGLLTSAGHLDDATLNELDKTRNEDLHYLGFKNITNLDASKPFTQYDKKFDAVLTNPPFGSVDSVFYGKYEITSLEQLMALRGLDTMKDDGKSAIIIGGWMEYDSEGRLRAGKNRTFFVYLWENYNIEDIININGQQLYSRQGTAFPTRLILINGRKKEQKGYFPLLDKQLHKLQPFSNQPMMTFEELWKRVNNFIAKPNKVDSNQFENGNSKKTKQDWLNYQSSFYKDTNSESFVKQSGSRLPDDADYDKMFEITELLLKRGKDEPKVAVNYAEFVVLGRYYDPNYNDIRKFIGNKVIVNDVKEAVKELLEFGYDVPKDILDSLKIKN